MREPQKHEWVHCPNGGQYEFRKPKKVWDNREGDTERTYGLIPTHKHGSSNDECEYSGLPILTEDNPLRGFVF